MAEARDTQNAELDPPEIWIPPPDRKAKPKIEDLLKIYDDVIEFLKQEDYDEDLRKALNIVYSAYENIPTGNHERKPHYLQVLELRKEDLKRIESGITIAGDTSSGKTSLVNKLVGERLVTPKVLAATSKICRMRNSKTYAIEVLDRDGKVLKERTAFTNHKKMNKKLDKYTCMRGDNAGMYYIDIYCPFRNLDVKGNVMLVDTPGISGERGMNSKLMEFLPNASGFIFVIDVSRAGGVEEDRLLAILQTIAKARNIMPCFEPDDVLFVTNKWNLLQCSARSLRTSETATDDSDDEKEPINEEEEIWNTIVNKIKAVWPTLTEDQIFRLNLSDESTDCGTEKERNQFRRFVDVLAQLLEKTKSKKVKMHISLLFDTICNIDIGIQSRIHTATSDDENIVGIFKDAYISLERLLQKCRDIVTELQYDMKMSVGYLSDKLHTYINSADGKHEILNPVGKIPIKDCFLVSREVPRRFQDGVMRWVRGKEVVDEIEKIDGKILKKCEEVRLGLERARVIFMGKEDQVERTKLSTVLTAAISAPLWMPVAIVIGALLIVATIVLSPLIITGMVLKKGMKEKQIDTLYNACAQLLTKAEIRNRLGSVFNDHFEHRIKRIFEKELPREIDALIYTFNVLGIEKDKIIKDLTANLRLRDSLYEIKGDLEKLT